MAHPKRKRWIPDLQKKLDTTPRVIWDEINDRWDTGRRSLLAYDPDATHHLVIQDDALPCRDLVAGLESMAAITKHRPVCAYMGRNPRYRVGIETAQRNGCRFIETSGPWWGVAILLPVEHIKPIVAYGDKRTDIENYDRRIGLWYARQGLSCLYTLPSLVEHRHGGQNPSLISHRTGTRRKAWSFVGENASALDIDWSLKTQRVTPSYAKQRPTVNIGRNPQQQISRNDPRLSRRKPRR